MTDWQQGKPEDAPTEGLILAAFEGDTRRGDPPIYDVVRWQSVGWVDRRAETFYPVLDMIAWWPLPPLERNDGIENRS